MSFKFLKIKYFNKVLNNKFERREERNDRGV